MADEVTENEDAISPKGTLWRETPQVFIDNIIGASTGSGVHRIVCGQLTFDPRADAAGPMTLPVLTIVVPHANIDVLIEGLKAIRDDYNERAEALTKNG
jgi:hypothetical protein